MSPQPPPLTTADGTYTPPPTLRSHPPQSPPSDLHRSSLKSFTHSQLIDRLLRAERQLLHYQKASSDLLAALALTPDMTEAYYARTLRELLYDGLKTLDSVDELSHIECSFPCVKGEMPSVELVRWEGLGYSEWDVSWAPDSWWVSVSAIGTRWGLSFNSLTTVTNISLTGCLQCAFSSDMSSVRVAFRDAPLLEMAIESVVGWGVVPIPVRESIEEMVRYEIERFVKERLTEDNVVLVLRRRVLGLSQGDLNEALLAAKRAGNVNLRAQTLL